jgi:hypothetical protein
MKYLPLALLALIPSIAADTIELRSGELLNGRYLGGTMSTVRFEVDRATRTIPVTEIIAITFEGTAAAPQAAPTSTSPVGQPDRAPASAPTPAASVVVPAGTKLLVRTQEPVDSNRHRAGHRFTCRLEGDLRVGGQVAASKGTMVYGQLTAAQRSRRLVGRSELLIVMNGISVDGKVVALRTSECKAVSENTTRQTLGRTARGAVIGALIDGSDGAETGAKVGLGVSVLTSGSSIHIPTGTLLEFTLEAPVRL